LGRDAGRSFEHGRRDWVFIYTGDQLGATVKGRYKRHWLSSGEGVGTGTAAVFYDLITDPRESNPKLASLIWQSGQWDYGYSYRLLASTALARRAAR
jgi:hypothetical protein